MTRFVHGNSLIYIELLRTRIRRFDRVPRSGNARRHPGDKARSACLPPTAASRVDGKGLGGRSRVRGCGRPVSITDKRIIGAPDFADSASLHRTSSVAKQLRSPGIADAAPSRSSFASAITMRSQIPLSARYPTFFLIGGAALARTASGQPPVRSAWNPSIPSSAKSSTPEPNGAGAGSADARRRR